MKHTFSITQFVFLTVFSQSIATASQVEWKADEAIALGSGCNSIESTGREVDTFILANGEDVSVVWSGLQLHLVGRDDKLADRKTCSLRIPVSTTPGWYISEIEQHLSHFLLKSRGARVSISSRANVGAAILSPLSVSYPSHPAVRTIYDNSRVDALDLQSAHVRSWCHNSNGIYRFDVAISAQRETHEARIIAGVEEDIRLDLSQRLSPCPGSEVSVLD